MLKVSLGTIKGRHNLPVTSYIFNEEIKNVTDVEKIENDVKTYFISNILPMKADDDVQVILYITGLTIVTLAVVKACKVCGCELVCMHYDRDSDTYIAQKIIEI